MILLRPLILALVLIILFSACSSSEQSNSTPLSQPTHTISTGAASLAAPTIKQTQSIFRLPNNNLIHSVNFSPDGKQILLAGSRGVAHLIERETGATRPLTATGDLLDGAIASSGTLVLLSEQNGMSLWDRLGQRVATLDVVVGRRFAHPQVQWARDGSTFIALQGSRIGKWSMDGKEQPFELPLADLLPMCVAWSPDGALLAVGSLDGRIMVVDMMTMPPTLIRTITMFPKAVTSLGWSPDSQSLAMSSSEAGQLAVLRRADWQPSFTLPEQPESQKMVMWSPDSVWLAVADGAGKITLRDKQGQAHQVFNAQSKAILSAAWSQDGKWLLTTDGNVAQLWSAQ